MDNHPKEGDLKPGAVINLGIASTGTHTPHGLLTPMDIDAAGTSIPRNGLLARGDMSSTGEPAHQWSTDPVADPVDLYGQSYIERDYRKCEVRAGESRDDRMLCEWLH